MQRLEGREGVNTRVEPGGSVTWDCSNNFRGSAVVLARMGLTAREIEETFQYFVRHGGYCDCEVLLNVASS